MRKAVRGEDGNRLVTEPPECELERARRWGVDPLEVIERNDHGPQRSERSQRAEHRDPDGVSVRGVSIRLGEKERDLQRAPLGWWKRRKDAAEILVQQVTEHREGERGLRLAGSSLQEAEARALRRLDPTPPQGRLPDPGITLEQERAGEGVRRLEELTDGDELLFPADRIRGGEGALDDAFCSGVTTLARGPSGTPRPGQPSGMDSG
jgi:hypothetical protein